MATDLLFNFSVNAKSNAGDGWQLVQNALIDGETIELCYKSMRDWLWFTNKRIIAYDVQGLTGSKKEYKSIPYSKISAFSVETAGAFDFDGDFKVWVSGMGCFAVKFAGKIDIKEVGRFLASKTLL